jgi:hypothetical protein
MGKIYSCYNTLHLESRRGTFLSVISRQVKLKLSVFYGTQ